MSIRDQLMVLFSGSIGYIQSVDWMILGAGFLLGLNIIHKIVQVYKEFRERTRHDREGE